MVVVDDYSVAELLLSTSSPSLAFSLSKKYALSLSTKPNSALSLLTKPASLSKKPASYVLTKPDLSNGRVAIRKSLAQPHRTMEAKANLNSLENTEMSSATWLLATQKDKPKSERLDSTQVVTIINKEFRSKLNASTICWYVNRGHI